MTTPLIGVVLTGGFSKRMGCDKALITYQDTHHYLWTARLLSQYCREVIISCRRDQALPGLDEKTFARLHDEIEGEGPITGILAAMTAHPAWAALVVACDLPKIDAPTIAHLIASRAPACLATCYRSASNGLPEPLCAIYEPAITPVLLEAMAQGRGCPRKLLIQQAHAVKAIDLLNPHALDNFNTPNDR